MPHVSASPFHAPIIAVKRTISIRDAMSRPWKIVLPVLGCLMLAIVGALILASLLISRRARAWAEDWLAHKYNGNVELSAFRVTIPFPLVQCEGENLSIHFQGRRDLPPLIA